MALNKEITIDNGAIANYHRINYVNLRDNVLSFSVASYLSEVYRALERPINETYYEFDISVKEEESMGIRRLCYSKLKELEQWASATDC